MRWRDLLIFEDTTLGEALEKLNDSKGKTLFVVNREQIILGSLSDGDIRRGLLASCDLGTKVPHVMNKKAIYVKNGTPYLVIKKMFSDLKILAIPVVDEKNRIQEIKMVGDESHHVMDNFVPMIMAGGEGRRMLPVTSSIPKPLVQVGDETLIGRNLKRLSSDGFKEVYISINYLGDKVRNYLGNGSEFGLRINYLAEKSPLGTAGSVSLLPEDIKSKNVLVCNADLVHQISYVELCEFHLRHKPDISLASQLFEVKIPFGQLIFAESNKVAAVIEKPSYQISIYAGISIVSPNIAETIRKEEKLDMTELIVKTIGQGGRVLSHENLGYWYDVGNPASLDFLNSTFFSPSNSKQ